MRSWFRLLAFLLVAALPVAAQDFSLVVRPSQPEPGDMLEVTLSGTWRDSCIPRYQRTEEDGSIIRLIFFVANAGACLPVVTPFSETVTAGPLGGGSYRIEAIAEYPQDERILLAERVLEVTEDVAPSPANFERVLLPVMYEGPGALGSFWTTQLSLYNSSDEPIEPWEFLVLCPPGESCDSIPPRAAVVLGPQQLLTWVNGYVLAIPRDRMDDFHATLHSRDLSRQAESWGTEIPVVREDDLPSKIVLLNVPLDDRFRRTLRIYDIRGIDGIPVRMRWYRMDTGAEVAAREILLRTVARCAIGPCWLPDPAAATLPLEAPFPAGLGPDDRVRIEIEPLASDTKLWAFVSITNNATQQVTTISPQ